MRGVVFVYDDDCGFCTWWAEYFERRTDMKILGFSELDGDLGDRLPAAYERCSHVLTADEVYSCGASIEEAMLRTRWGSVLRPVFEQLRRLKPYRLIREWAYRRGANNRDKLGALLSRTPPVRRSDDS